MENLVYIVYQYDMYTGKKQDVNKVFANAQDASDYCKEMNKKFWGVHYEYQLYKVN